MPLIIGVTAGGVLVPVQVDADGVVSVSAAVSSLPSLPAGDNNIGNVDIVSLPSLAAGTNNIGDVDVLTLPALPIGTNEIGKIQARNYGLVGGSFQKDPIRLGFSAIKSLYFTDITLAAGTVTTNGPAVPAGEIWVMTNISFAVNSATITKVVLSAVVGGNTVFIETQLTPTSGLYYAIHGFWLLAEGDYFRGATYATTLNDDFIWRSMGYRIDIDQ